MAHPNGDQRPRSGWRPRPWSLRAPATPSSPHISGTAPSTTPSGTTNPTNSSDAVGDRQPSPRGDGTVMGDGAPGCAEATPRLQRVYQSWWYSSLVTLVILSNTTLLTVQSVWALPPPLLTTLDWVFLGIFTAEMLFGIAALGLVRPRGYFRGGWTILDAGVVAAGWVAALSARGSGLSSFRALRILQPMGRVPAMRALVGTLVGSRSPTAVRL
uniref:Ion transport domain-containing protein n=1 Tax=Eutreptiella gymnastica TaxID=73025 RepID=A0A7S4FPV3_9EUGL